VGRLKLARNIIRILLLISTILIITTCENDLQNYIFDDLFGPPYRKEVAKLLPTNGSTTEDFGFSVDIDGDYAIVGAPFGDGIETDSGAAYIFTRDSNGTWNLGQRVTASDGTTGDSFGHSVAISEGWAVVGAEAKDVITGTNDANEDGKIYIYQQSINGIWIEKQDIDITDLNNGNIEYGYDQLGYSVALDGAWMVLGARGDNLDNSNTDQYGATYILKRTGDTWAYDDKLDGTIRSSSFGAAVDIIGDILAIGASGEDTDGNVGVDPVKQGAVYVYRFVVDGWVLSDKVTASIPTHKAHLGKGVSISTNYMIAGAYGEGIAGTASFFTRSGSDEWDSSTVQQLEPETQKTGDVFGWGIATDGSYILAGAPMSDYHAPLSGAVALYEINENGNIGYLQNIAPDNISGLKGWGISIAIDSETAIIGQNDDPFNGANGAAYIFE